MPDEKIITNPTKVIRAKCLDCSCGNPYEVEHCPVKRCPLWLWRSGKNPYRQKKEYTEEELAVLRERMKLARSKKLRSESLTDS